MIAPLGIPIEFVLFALMLVGVALFHRKALAISVIGLLVIFAFETLVTAYPTGRGVAAFAAHARHEWVTIANLFLLLVGFELLSNQFERSNISDHLPNLLPDGYSGSVALLAVIFVLAAFLDNIAAAVLGGVMARHLYRGRVTVAFIAALVAASNAGGAGSVIGDTTTTIMWLKGVSALTVLPAYVAAVPAFLIVALFGARAQHRFQPIMDNDEPGHALEWRRIWIVAFILAAAVTANVLATSLERGGNGALARIGAVGRDPRHQPVRAARLVGDAAWCQGCGVPRLPRRRCVAHAAEGLARTLMADRVRARNPVVGVRQYPADRAGAPPGRL